MPSKTSNGHRDPVRNRSPHRRPRIDPLADRPPRGGRRAKLHRIIFGTRTPMAKGFDVALLVVILLSVLTVLLESVPAYNESYGKVLRIAEWIFTVLFTIEYGLRLWTVAHPRTYALSFFGIVDLMAILPTYLSALVSGSQSLAVVREIRLLRVFRVLKLARHMTEARALTAAMAASRPKIVVFLTGVISVASIFGTIMYLVEGDQAGFTSIPTSIYWAVVTMTTVGYGDIAPRTAVGQLLALILMVVGYAIIAVPTGIVSAELTRAATNRSNAATCKRCGRRRHARDAVFCDTCGTRL